MAHSNFEKQRELIDDLKRMDVDEAKRRTVAISPSAVQSAMESNTQFQFCDVSIGMCPYDGSRCADGGELLRKEGSAGASKNVYGPVEPRDCVMCRHFISGPPWLNELEAFGTKLCEKRQYLAREEERINELVGHYEQAYLDRSVSHAEFKSRMDDLGVEIQNLRDKQESTENALFNVERLCAASVKLIEQYSEEDHGIAAGGERPLADRWVPRDHGIRAVRANYGGKPRTSYSRRRASLSRRETILST